MKTFLWLIKREFWEHRGGFLRAPVITAAIFLLLNLMGIVTGEVMGRQMGFQLGMGSNNLHLLTRDLGQQSMDAVGAGLDLVMYSSTMIISIVLGFARRSRSRLTMPRDLSVSGQCRLTTSERSKSSSSVQVATASPSRSALPLGR